MGVVCCPLPFCIPLENNCDGHFFIGLLAIHVFLGERSSQSLCQLKYSSTYVWVSVCLLCWDRGKRPEEDIRSSGAGVKSGYELLNMGAGNWTQLPLQPQNKFYINEPVSPSPFWDSANIFKRDLHQLYDSWIFFFPPFVLYSIKAVDFCWKSINFFSVSAFVVLRNYCLILMKNYTFVFF